MPAYVTLEVVGFDRAMKRMAAIRPDRIVRGAKFFTKKRFQEGLKAFSEEAPKGETKELSQSVILELEDQGDVLMGAYIATARHAPWVISGTGVLGPHKQPIRPVKAKVLRFFKENRWIMARQVRGQPPNPFMSRARQRVRSNILSTLPTDIRRDIQVIVGGGG